MIILKYCPAAETDSYKSRHSKSTLQKGRNAMPADMIS